jgi:hypothetical protein
MGRISHELVQVMPDERTALMGDDATNGGLFMFVADSRGPLRRHAVRGHLEADLGRGPGRGCIGWIRLGHATSAEIKALVDGGIRPTDIMDVATTDPADASYTASRSTASSTGSSSSPAWRRPPPSWKPTATPPWWAAAWASPRWRAPPSTPRTSAPTRPCHIQTGMLNGSGGIRVQGPKAGGLRARAEGGQKDSSARPINSEWVPRHGSRQPPWWAKT